MVVEKQRRMLEQLPTKLIQHILNMAPDIQSLAAVVLGGPRLYRAFLYD